MKLFLLKWLISWGYLAEGVIGVLTFGRWAPSLALAAARVYAKAKHDLSSMP